MNRSEFPAILITAATGNIYIELTKQLGSKGIPFSALVRNRENSDALSLLKEAEIFEGDLANSESIARA